MISCTTLRLGKRHPAAPTEGRPAWGPGGRFGAFAKRHPRYPKRHPRYPRLGKRHPKYPMEGLAIRQGEWDWLRAIYPWAYPDPETPDSLPQNPPLYPPPAPGSPRAGLTGLQAAGIALGVLGILLPLSRAS